MVIPLNQIGWVENVLTDFLIASHASVFHITLMKDFLFFINLWIWLEYGHIVMKMIYCIIGQQIKKNTMISLVFIAQNGLDHSVVVFKSKDDQRHIICQIDGVWVPW